MRVLLTAHHLIERAGSELYNLELSTALREQGHDVRVFTFYPGPVSDQFVARGIPVYSIDELQAVREFAPQIAHVHHAPCLFLLASLGLGCPAIFSSLGKLPPLEQPPVVFDGVGLGLVVSEEVQQVFAASPFGKAVPVRVFRNWFDERQVTRARPRPVEAVRNVVVVTNHLDPTLAQQLDGIAATRPGFRWVHWGLPNHSLEITPSALEPFDAVITLGRGALMAAACGKPVLLYDVHGCDGWIDAARLHELATRNFSGRLLGHRPTREELEGLLFDEPRRLDLDSTVDRLFAEFGLRARVETLTAVYDDVARSGLRLLPQAYGPFGQIYLEAVRGHRSGGHQIFALKSSLEQRDDQLREAQARLRASEEESTRLAERLHRTLAAIGDQVARDRGRITELEAEREHWKAAAEADRAELEALLARSVEHRARELVRRVAPAGSPHRALLEAARRWTK